MSKQEQEEALKAMQELDSASEEKPSDSNQEDSKPEEQKTEEVVEETKSEKTEEVKEDETKVENPEETKPDETKVESKQEEFEIDGEKLTVEQIRQMREDSKNKSEWTKKLTQDSQEQARMKEVIDKMASIFSEDKKEDKFELTPEEQEFRTQADALMKDPYVKNIVQELVEEKLKEKESFTQLDQAKKKLTEEIQQLEKELDGNDGRPKYVDKEVLEWQKKNNLLMLKPKQAYEMMYKDAIVEWEIQKRLKNKGEAPTKINTTQTDNNISKESQDLNISSDEHTRRSQMLDLLTQMDSDE